jgi:flagellar basal body-associated protein FliL
MTNANTKANWKEVASLAAKHWILLLIIAVIAILAAGFVAAANAEKKRVEANKESAK